MLPSYFYQFPPGYPQDTGLQLTILGYAKYQDLTLVYWKVGNEEEHVRGQSLYRGNKLLASGGGSILVDMQRDGEAQSLGSHWRDRRRGMDEMISEVEARMLKDPKNYIPLKPG